MFTAIICLFAYGQAANACLANQPLTKLDVAFAEVVFEGSVREVHHDGTLTFEIYNVIRGELPEKQVTIGSFYGVVYPKLESVEDFIKIYGDYTRIALTMPQQVEKFCRREKRLTNYSDGNKLVSGYEHRPICDYSLSGLRQVRAKDIPFILRRPCGQPYIFSVEKYEKMQNYDVNIEKLNQLEKEQNAAITRELYQDVIGGVGPLPWNQFPHDSANIAVDLYREYPAYFTPNLKDDEAMQDWLLERAVELTNIDESASPDFENYQSAVDVFKRNQLYVLLKVAALIEKDSALHDRLLEIDELQ